MKTAPRTSPGLRQISKGLGALDAEVFEAIANSRSPLLDTAMPALSRAADNAKLWFAIAAAMALSGSRSARRGPWCRQPGGDKCDHQSAGETGVATPAAPIRVGSVGAAPAPSKVVLDAL